MNLSLTQRHKLAPMLIFLGLALLILRCATRQPPPGGPEDKTPPRLLSSFPRPDSTNVRDLEYLEFEFDENLDRGSLRNQVWILPELPGPFEIKWKGNKKFRIVFEDSLESNQTYLATIGAGLKDLRGNTLNEPVVLPFSTGPTIDRGEISGQVLGEQAQNVFIYAYPVREDFPDSTIFHAKPRYYTQAGKSGEFRIKYLKPGVYRVYALDDQSGDRLYTLQTDRVGIPFSDVTLAAGGEQTFQHLNFTLIREDTTGPAFVRARALTELTVELSFNEALDPARHIAVEIEDSAAHTPLRVLAREVAGEERDKLILYTEAQQAVRYSAWSAPLRDEYGNSMPLDTLRFVFSGSAQPDTSTARLIEIYPPDKQKNLPYDLEIRFKFSHPVDSVSLKSSFKLLDSDSLPVAGRWRFPSLLAPEYAPDSSLKKGAAYSMEINLAGIKNVFEKPFGDTLFVYQFSTWEWSELGEIGGTVRVQNPGWEKAIIEATPVKGTEIYSVIVNTNQPYLIPFLPDGLYRLKAIIDLNQNGRYDGGQSFPFRHAEPFRVLPDTVKVRKRWTTEGVDIRFEP